MTDFYYMTDDGNVHLTTNEREWIMKVHNNRIVDQTTVGDYLVSTVFLGIDHNFGRGLPILFETMVFNNKHNELYCDRYHTKQEAVEGHKKIVGMVTRGEIQEDTPSST